MELQDTNLAIGRMDLSVFLNGVSTNFIIDTFGVVSSQPIANLKMTTDNSIDPAATLPLNVDIVLTDTGYSLPPTPLFLSQTVNLLGNAGGPTATATGVGYYGASNTEFDTTGAKTTTATSALAAGVATNTIGTSGLIVGAHSLLYDVVHSCQHYRAWHRSSTRHPD